MEIDQKFIGSRLQSIEKDTDMVRLVFQTKNGKISIIAKGILFETIGFTLNQPVREIQLSNSLGFKARTKLEQLHKNPKNYRQLFIEMQEVTSDKNELIGALSDIKFAFSKISGKTASTVKKKSTKHK